MKVSLALAAIGLAVAALLGASRPAWGQAAAAAPAGGASSASERAAHEGDKVFKWILMHSDKPRKTREPGKDAAAAAPVPAAKDASVREAKAEAQRPSSRSEKAAAAMPPAAAGTVAPEASRPPEPIPAATAVAALAPPSARQEPPAAAAPASEDDDDLPLVLKKQVDPEFPGWLMRNLRKGSVQVKFTVQADGSVGNTEIVKTTYARLNTAATAAVKQWRFEPLRHAQLGIVELGFDLD